jgi:3'(2'), 5'-bisphosphate nucleotidase
MLTDNAFGLKRQSRLCGADFTQFVEIITRLATQGGEIALQMRSSAVRIEQKADMSPVTAADLAVDAHIFDGLSREFPDIPIITEERVASHVAGKAGAMFFLVDPIDGTKEFIAERGEFTVNIALIEDGVPVAGAVCAPAIGRVFAGAAGQGAFETGMKPDGRRFLQPKKPDNDALIVVASRSHLTEPTQQFIDANAVERTINAGSSLKFCLLAAGEADLYPRFGPTMEWDTAAGHAILSAAGGFVEEISRLPLKYGKPDYRNGNFIAYTPGTKFRLPVSLQE